jgi:hypothetical protein
MKNLLGLIAMILLPMIATAQEFNGKKIIEGNLSYNITTDEFVDYNGTSETKTQYLTINPKMGWFITNSSVLGMGIGFEYNKTDREGYFSYKNKEQIFSFAPYFRNYQKITAKLYYTTTINLSLGFGKTNIDDSYKANITNISLFIQPGLSYFIAEKWALKANFGSIYYSNDRIKITEGLSPNEDSTLKDETAGISFNMDSFSLGLGYYF